MTVACVTLANILLSLPSNALEKPDISIIWCFTAAAFYFIFVAPWVAGSPLLLLPPPRSNGMKRSHLTIAAHICRMFSEPGRSLRFEVALNTDQFVEGPSDSDAADIC